jgi:hypothetical protein
MAFFSYVVGEDIIRVSLRLTYCLNYRYIADIARYALRTGADDITSFFGPSKFQLCWRNQRFLSLESGCVIQRYHSFYLI